MYGSKSQVPDYFVDGQGVGHRIISDHLGSVRVVINSETGKIEQRLEHDEFGRVLRDTNSCYQPFGFAGGLYDGDTGLVHFGVRDYDPETGRWTSKDPILFAGGDTNLYGYVMQDPVNLVDPSGLSARDVVRIRNRFAQHLNDMSRYDLRRPGSGYLNGLLNNLSANFSDTRLGCHGQASSMREQLGNITTLDDDWTFFTNGNLWRYHFNVIGTSSNPKDPILEIDPWKGSIVEQGR